ncbi:MAG: DUF1801 domain-containing protein [Chitinophagia bacterium]|nr:DUF1801 domain-containing protein [Chitinophagia bacterium]
MATQKTLPSEISVNSFLQSKADSPEAAAELMQLQKWMEKVTGYQPVMWGEAIVGYGSYSYQYASKHSGTAPLIAFSPRKSGISLYVMAGIPENEKLITQLGKCKQGKGCLQIKSLKQIDLSVLEQMIQTTIQHLQQKYPQQ